MHVSLSTPVYVAPKLRPNVNDDADGYMQCMRTCMNECVLVHVCILVFFVINRIQSDQKKWARLIFLRIERSQPIKTQA